MSILAHLDIDLDQVTVELDQAGFDVGLVAEMPGIDIGVAGPAGPPGPLGPRGPLGLTTSLFEYTYSTSTTPPPGAGTLRSDAATAATSTTLWVHKQDQQGVDHKPLLLSAGTGDVLYVQDKDDSTCFVRYHLTADPLDAGVYVTYAVTITDVAVDLGPTPLSGNKSIVFGVVTPGPVGPAGPPGPPGAEEVIGAEFITVGATAPVNPGFHDVWIDTT